MDGLVYIGKVISVEPISNADKIEQLDIDLISGGKWHGCAPVGQFSVEDTCQVYLQDSLLPQIDEFAFMEKYHYRVRMLRLRGVPSECLIMPQTISGNVGDDVTLLAGVTRYEKPLPTNLGGVALGYLPSYIPKTDEPNFQSLPSMVVAMQGKSYSATLKMDGSSMTVFLDDDNVLHVCSRNIDLKEVDGNVFWKLTRKYHLETVLQTERGIAIQAEACGPGIQSNHVGLKDHEMYVFNVFNIKKWFYYSNADVRSFCSAWGLHSVPFLVYSDIFNATNDGLRQMAEKTYPNGQPAEGIVIRLNEEMMTEIDGVMMRVSFKVLNLLYRD